ncbi:unnamed protein product [Miscanthus lutarioriparius]|uniref:Uncharacterized protein n=1 Tax=Miscanthus lutarioriparius TaxID=422564 RepID=A0A811P545_9POAL|nr:unnamed protein product [Miscanthus lutarioriparius]
MASWMYRSAIYLLTCVIFLFRLICHHQRLWLEDFAGSLLEEVEEGCAGVDTVLREHLDIRKQLKVIGHRFRKQLDIPGGGSTRARGVAEDVAELVAGDEAVLVLVEDA